MSLFPNAHFDLVVNISGYPIPGHPEAVEWKVNDPIGGSDELYRATDSDARTFERAIAMSDVRKELERSWRVFTREPAAAFRIVTARDDALRVLEEMESQQGARMQHLGLNFTLNNDTCAAFYRQLVDEPDAFLAHLPGQKLSRNSCRA